GDFGCLVNPACTILEAELDRLLTEPGRAIAASLVAALRVNTKDDTQAAILEKWAGRAVPTTLGIQSVVLLALRRGREHGLDAVTRFLADRFQRPYADLLGSKKLEACLNVVRTRFRN